MHKTIGIPRALYYYHYFPFWREFFERLGFEVVLSPETSKQIIDQGVSMAVDGTCLPVKVYYGHALELVKANVDWLWVPQIVSVAKREYICPKFMGLPDMIEKNFPNGPKVLSPVIDAKKSPRDIFLSYWRLARRFARTTTATYAYIAAWSRQNQYEKSLTDGYYLPQVLERKKLAVPESPRLRIGLVGHSYLMYDKFISMNILQRLLEWNIQVVTPEQIQEDVLRSYSRQLPKRMFWTSGQSILGAVGYLSDKIDGIISLAAFACGTDSLTSELVERKARSQEIPHLLLNIDEQTGEAGMITRVEAFLDMLERRQLA